MNPELRKQVIIGAACLVLGGLIGFQLMPTKVEIREKIVEKKTSDTERTRDREVVRVREKRPDGTEVVRTELRDRQAESAHTSSESSKESEKIVTRGSGLGVAIMVADPLTNRSFGVMADKTILGPAFIGGFWIPGTAGGVTLGVRF